MSPTPRLNPSAQTSSRKGLTGGFTLVELLVVIGIIAVLIGILLPALQSARRQAMAIKCASSMRELGNAISMYVNENKGWAPPLRVRDYYTLSFPKANPSEVTLSQNYWFSFIAKYVTGTAPAAVGSTANQADNQKSVLWGCPAWEGYPGATGTYVGGINTSQTGYGFNCFPEYTPSFPDPNNLPSDPTTWYALGDTIYPTKNSIIFPRGAPHTAATAGTINWQDLDHASPNNSGQWYKWTQYTKPTERAILSDATFYVLESQMPPGGVIAGQHVYTASIAWSDSNATGAYVGQTTGDFYRHGKVPAITNKIGNYGVFDPKGGKVAYNVLYCDGHVATAVDRETIYRATRMKFPG